MAGYKRHRGGDSWQLIVTIGSDFTGKPKRYTKTVHCKNEKEADRELTRFWANCEEGIVNTSKPTTVFDLCGVYLSSYCEKHHKISALRSDKTAINVWIKPLLGKKKINKLSTYDVQQWVDFLIEQGKSPKTIRNYFSVLSSMMNYGIKIMKIINVNPCDNVVLPNKVKKKAKYYQKEELKMMLEALNLLSNKELKYKCAIYLAMFGGFRKAEILGFDWSDLDEETRTLHVRQTRLMAKGEGIYIDTPKTENSIRDVVVPGFIIDELKKLRIQQKENKLLFGRMYADSPAMIRENDGTPLSPQKLYRWFVLFCEENNLPSYGLHALRHTHASLLANIGADKVQVSQRLGHSQLSTTLNIYTHLFENTDSTVADQLEAYAENGMKKDAAIR